MIAFNPDWINPYPCATTWEGIAQQTVYYYKKGQLRSLHLKAGTASLSAMDRHQGLSRHRNAQRSYTNGIIGL